MQLYQVKRMIRGLGDVTSSTYSQTLNGYAGSVTLVNRIVKCDRHVGRFW